MKKFTAFFLVLILVLATQLCASVCYASSGDGVNTVSISSLECGDILIATNSSNYSSGHMGIVEARYNPNTGNTDREVIGGNYTVYGKLTWDATSYTTMNNTIAYQHISDFRSYDKCAVIRMRNLTEWQKYLIINYARNQIGSGNYLNIVSINFPGGSKQLPLTCSGLVYASYFNGTDGSYQLSFLTPTSGIPWVEDWGTFVTKARNSTNSINYPTKYGYLLNEYD